MERLQHALNYSRKLTLKREDRTAFVYLIGCHEFIKVGIAEDVNLRLITLQTGCPYELKLITSWPVSKAAESERRLHALWRSYEVRGEWFRVPAGDLAAAMNCQAFEQLFER